MMLPSFTHLFVTKVSPHLHTSRHYTTSTYPHFVYPIARASVQRHRYLLDTRRHQPGITGSAGVVSANSAGSAPIDKPNNPVSKLKDPVIPEGHPIDTDGRPLGHVIPDYDVELPVLSWGGYTKDFEAWAEPPTFPSTVWPKIAKYDYEELETKEFPVVYEVNMIYVIYALCILALLISIGGTRYELYQYYKTHGDYYKNGWPCFHYEPTLDIVPLTNRDDGLSPESLILKFDPQLLRHEMKDDEDDADDDDVDSNDEDADDDSI